MRRLFIVLLIIFILATSQPGTAQTPVTTFAPGAHLRFEHLTINDGLSQNAGLALLQDRQGYLWIGTQDGLNRYDGYHITTFKHDPDNPASLSYNGVLALYEDAAGFLWVGTWGGGLNRYNPKTGEFTRYQPDPADPASLSHPVVTSITPDEQGGLWVGTLGGLERFNPATGKFSHFRHDPANPNSLSSNAISAILPAEKGQLWVGTGAYSTQGAGLNRLNPDTGTVERLAPSGECLQSPNISDLLADPQGNLWISFGGYGVTGGGIDRYHPQTGVCAHFDNAKTFDNQITDNNVTDLMFDQDGALWAASWSSGVWHTAPGRLDTFTGIHHNPADPESLSNNNTFSLLQDRSGIIWIGTLSAGINKLNLDILQFRTYRKDAANPTSLPSNHVGAFAQTSGGTMWVGTWENGLARFDPAGGTFQEFRSDPKNPQSLSSDLVMSLQADPDGSLWVGTLGGGLNHFDPRSGLFTHYQNDPANPASLLENQVTTIFHDPAGRLWVGNFSGLSRLDPGASGFVSYPMAAPPVSLQIIGSELWIGTWGGGVFRLDLSNPANLSPATAAFTAMKHDPAKPNSLSEDSVWTIHAGPDGLVWLGTQGGLNRYNPKNGEFKAFIEKDGLRNATILGILEDRLGFLWLTTNNGLAKFSPQTETFRIYDRNDGLQSNEFNSNSYFQAANGEIYVGGVSGFSVFDPNHLRDSTNPPAVVLTKFSVFNTTQPFDATGQTPIRLNYDQNFIAFEFAALDFHTPQKNLYAYILEGFDKDWVQAGTRNYANYTNLPGGEYTFRVRAANPDGAWNQPGTSLRLTVIPPFWQTLPFLLGLFLGTMVLIGAGFQWRVRAVRRQNANLQQLVLEQRRVEAELRESETRFRAIYENAAIGISLIAPDRKVLAVNPTLLEMSGYSETELKELRGLGITYPEDLWVGQAEFGEILSGTRRSYQVEKRYVHKDGRIQWMRQTISAVHDSAGQLLYLVAIAEDIDRQKRAIEDLRESEARFKAMFENTAVGVALMSLDRHIIQTNPAATRITGYSSQEMAGINPSDLVTPEDRYLDRELFMELIAGQRDQYLMEKRYIRKDGGIFWGRVNFALVRSANDSPLYIIGIIEDITEEKRSAERLAAQEAEHRHLLEQRIAERTTELNQANERLREKAAQDAVTAERTRLARDLHDAVTQTLFSATLIADVLPDIWEMNPAEGKRRLEEVRQLTRGALAEMRTLLVELRPNALVEVPLPTLLRQLTEALTGRARIHIQLNSDTVSGTRKLPADVQVGLYRIAQEALNNVFKHAKASQAVVTLRMGETVRLTVADDGCGFDPATVTADHLGLKIMRERAEAIGAKLTLYSEPGEGTQISTVWDEKTSAPRGSR